MAFLLSELGWPDIEEYLHHDDRLILVVGSTEQHGRHMTFASDVWQPWEIARRLSERTGVLLAPPLNYGMSLHHLSFPGSLSLRPQTLVAVIADLLRSAYGHGFRHILLLNGHGGNTASLQVALVEVLDELDGLEVRQVQWWQLPAVARIFASAFPDLPAGHADASETSVILAIRPDVVRLERAAYSPKATMPPFLSRQVFARRFPHGVIGGDPRQASAEVGEQVLEAAAAVCEEILRNWTRNT